jgi:hypothetical protein
MNSVTVDGSLLMCGPLKRLLGNLFGPLLRFGAIYLKHAPDYLNEMAVPVHFCAAQQLFNSGTALQETLITASAFNAAALAFIIPMARSEMPQTRPPAGAPEQSAPLTSDISLNDFAGASPGLYAAM